MLRFYDPLRDSTDGMRQKRPHRGKSEVSGVVEGRDPLKVELCVSRMCSEEGSVVGIERWVIG